MPASLGDQYLVCRSCGTTFLWTGAQRRESSASRPDRCPACRAIETLAARHTGHLAHYNRRNGYGFIQDDDGGSVFVHASELGAKRGSSPAIGTRLEYYVEQSERGPRSASVRMLDDVAATEADV